MRDSSWAMSYEKAAGRIEELCSTLSPDVAVPACPGWTTGKLMAHLAGLTEDWVAGDLDPYASPEWTSRQVARLTGRSLGEVVEAWRQARRSFAELPESAEMGDPAMWALGDALVHEADLHEALGRGTRPPTEAVLTGLKFGIARWRAHLSEAGVSSLRIDVVDAREYWCGAPDDEAPVLRGESWEVFRLLYGRRSADQVTALVQQGSARPIIEAGLPYPFHWSELDLGA